MTKDIVISLFDYSGTFVKPWLEAGYECYLFDIKHKYSEEERGKLHLRYADLRDWDSLDIYVEQELDLSRVAFVAAFPPCTHLAVSGAQWFKGKGLRPLAESIECFATAAEFCEWVDAPYFIENPISTIATYWRKPDYKFQPWQYTGYNPSDNYTKQTCLWVGGGFKMPEANVDESLSEPDRKKVWYLGSKRRDTQSSVTPAGFSKAVFLANSEAR